jgi:hypothetical protein
VPIEKETVADKANDIAAIPLKLEQPPGAAKFYEIDPKTPIVEDGNTVLLAGYAGDNSFPLDNQSRAVGVTVQTGRFNAQLNSRTDLPYTYNPVDQFLLPYTRTHEGIRPHGISGAAAWCNMDHEGEVWAARPTLVGVQTSWFPKSKLLKIVRLGPVLSLLQKL